jgi:predicted aldo/keto reductase-like oxidoreductase
MEPLRGGNLAGRLPDAAEDLFAKMKVKRSHAEWALRWIWNHPQVTTILSGMTEMSQVEENLRLAAEAEVSSLTEEEIACVEEVKKIYQGRMKVPCTKCKYCMPCPAGVDIPGNLSSYNEYYLFDGERHRMTTRVLYGMMVAADTRPDKCTECGQCIELCPQKNQYPGGAERGGINLLRLIACRNAQPVT